MGHKSKWRQKNLITLKFLQLKVSHTCFNHQLFKDRLLTSNRDGLEEILPELTFTSNPLGHLELGVEVVVSASHLPDTDPVLSLEGELQGAPAKAGGQIHDEAHHVRQGNGINIPERVHNINQIMFWCLHFNLFLSFTKSSHLQNDTASQYLRLSHQTAS